MASLLLLLLPGALALLLLCHLGYAWMLLALPARLAPARLLLTPLLGYAIFTIVTATLTNLTALTPPQIALGLACICAPLNLWAWRTRRGAPGAEQPGGRQIGWQLVLMALAVLVYVSALAPALHTGAAPIGENWDAGEFYLPLGRALQLRSQRDLGQLPDNPLLDVLLRPPVSARIHAFSYLHASASSWSDVDPLRSLPALMALFLALSVPASAALGRVLGLGWRPLSLAVLLPGLHWLLLWATFNGFAMHVTAFGLLPAALAATMVAFDPEHRAGRRAVATAALLVGGLALSYNPALTAYVMLTATLWLAWLGRALLLQRGARRGPALWLLRRALLVALGAFLLSGISQYFFFFRDGFRIQYGERSPGMDISSYVPLAASLGFDPRWRGLEPGLPLPVAPVVGLALGLGALALLRRGALPLLALSVGMLAYQALMRAIDYHYGFYKGVTFEVPLIAVLLGAGLQALYTRAERLRSLRAPITAACGLLVLGATLSGWLGVQRAYWDASRRLFNDEQLEALGMRQALPAGAEVLVTTPPGQPRTFGGLLAYELLGHPLWGDLQTGYGALQRPLPPGRSAALALLPAHADPASSGYDLTGLRWSGAGLRLYKRGGHTTLLHTFEQRPQLLPQQSLHIQLGDDEVTLLDGAALEPSGPPGSRQQAALVLSSFGPARVELRQGASATTVLELPGGLVTFTTSAVDLPSMLVLHNVGQQPVYLWRIELHEPVEQSGIKQQEDALIQLISEHSAAQFSAALRLHTPQLPGGPHQTLTAVLAFSHIVPGQEPREVGRWVFFPSHSNGLRLRGDLRTNSVDLSIDGQPVELIGSAEPPAEGEYQASLLLANNGQVVAGYAMWHWRVSNGSVVDAYVDNTLCERVPLPLPATRLRYLSPQAPIRLEGFTLPVRQAAPAGTFEVTVVWQALARPQRDYRARLLLLDRAGAVQSQLETSLGTADHPPTRWQVGELGERTAALPLPAHLAAGKYMLAVELLGPEGTPLPLQTPEGDLLRVPLAAVEVQP